MSLRTTVKVSHLSNLSDARYCAGMGVDMLGFRAIPGTERYLSPNVFQDIRGWIAGPAIVAELYGISSPGQIREVIQAYAPDCLELSYDEYKRYRNELPLPLIVALTDVRDVGRIPHDTNISYLLVDENVSTEDIASSPHRVMVKVSHVNSLREKLGIATLGAVALDGPEEVRPGITNYDQLGGLLEALEDE